MLQPGWERALLQLILNREDRGECGEIQRKMAFSPRSPRPRRWFDLSLRSFIGCNVGAGKLAVGWSQIFEGRIVVMIAAYAGSGKSLRITRETALSAAQFAKSLRRLGLAGAMADDQRLHGGGDIFQAMVPAAMRRRWQGVMPQEFTQRVEGVRARRAGSWRPRGSPRWRRAEGRRRSNGRRHREIHTRGR